MRTDLVIMTNDLQIVNDIVRQNRQNQQHDEPASISAAQFSKLGQDDAFQTIIAWLYSRVRKVDK